MEGEVTAMTISEAIEQLFEVASKGLEFIQANPLMFLMFVSGFAFVGFKLVRSGKKAARA